MTSLRAVLFSAAFAPAAFAQVRTRPAVADSSAARIMVHVGTQPNAVWLRDILRQADANYPQAKLDQIADSLVARAIDSRGAQPKSDGQKRAVDAVNALVLAGSSAPLRGRAYAGALDRLIMVHRQAPSRDIRARALGGMLAVSSTGTRAVDYLSSVAASSDPTAYDAIEFLITDANGGSWAGGQPSKSQQQRSILALKALASGRRVSNPMAANLLENWISQHP
jgi:hypothetical protein